MEPKRKFKIVTAKNSRVILPNIFTLVGVCIGLSSIKFAFDGNFQFSVVAIIVAGIIDGLDGRIARLIRGTSKVGKELDSLTDVISFGVAPAFIMYFWTLNTLGKIGWLLSLIYVVCVALRLARFNISSGGDVSWKDNFFQGVPSPAGGILVLTPLVLDLSGVNLFNINFEIFTPYIFILVSILLISKVPTYSMKKIVVPRSTTVFLLFSIVLLFGLLLVFTFEVIVISCMVYILSIPISIYHFMKLKKKYSITSGNEDDELEDVL